MRNALIVFCCIISKALCAFPGDPKYPVSAIPQELKENVNVVVRHEEHVFKIVTRSKASLYVHMVITILNDKGEDYAVTAVAYDKLTKIRDINAAVYDAAGKQIKRLKNSDIYDQSAFDGSMFSDDRFKSINLSQSTYPYTVEWDYEVEYKFLFVIPPFELTHSEKMSSEYASYSLQYADGLKPRYRMENTDIKPTEGKTKEGLQHLTWEFRNTKPIKREPYGPSVEELSVSISAAPSTFEYEHYVGTMDTWDQYGRWISSLNEGRNILPEATRQKIRALTANAKSNEEKVKILYEYLQNKTRYVSIQLGIGGLQPFPAQVVDETGYGDCKALSNYMVAMLETVGIPSHYTLIRAGDDVPEMKTDFPSSQFNHVIVAVPNGRDTLWLECTNQQNPFGYQGRFTGDRKALVITKEGAKVVSTTRYPAEQNLQLRTADVTLAATGDAKAIVRTIYGGLQYENEGLDFVINKGSDDQKKWIQNNTEIPNFDVVSFSMKNNKQRVPSASVDTELSLRRFATVSGKRIFITPNLMNRFSFVPEKVDGRKTHVVRSNEYTDIDTIRYHLPEGIYPEFLPEPVKLTSAFGEYESSFKVDQGSLLYVRRVKMNKGKFPAETYSQLVDFYKNINKADNTKLVFLSKT